MKPFLYDIAKKIYESHTVLDKVTLIFPNRRAVLYFRKHLSAILTKPTFSPQLITVEDFISSFSTKEIPDKLELIYRLHKSYNKTVISNESFDQFYFWGEMLLRDFDEVDKYLVQAEMLFKDLSHQKELDASFDYLTDDQKTFLLDFWGNFDEQKSKNKAKFLEVWKHLGEVYIDFRDQLQQAGLAYQGMQHREVAENLKNLSDGTEKLNNVSFIGFNALTKAEETIISHCLELGSTVYWDIDEYYVNNVEQEAGLFFREYQKQSSLGKTFDGSTPSYFRNPKSVNVYGAPQPVGQAKLMAQTLLNELSTGKVAEETLVVLPDEKLLLPVLHGISGGVEKLNVTMGFPLSSTPMFSMIEFLIELQINRKDDHFHHRQVLSLLNHPYSISSDPAIANAKRKEINRHNWVSIPKSFLATGTELHRVIFVEAETATIVDYLRSVIVCVGALDSIADFDKEYAFYFLKSLNRIQEVLGSEHDDLRSFLRFFRQYIRSQKIPFSGEPLKGLQVMGMLETRNLDFKNVYILSLNEGSLPQGSGKGSYIPYSIRKAYALPTPEHQDAMYAYLFYRVLQRAENVFLFYNTETDVLGQGEMSRYLQQLIYESGLKIQSKILHNPIRINPVTPISIKKDAYVLNALKKLNEGSAYSVGISPSALNAYLDCRLRFFFRHVMKIREPDEVEEDMDARVLGNFLHDVMEMFYSRLIASKKNNQIEASDFNGAENEILKLLDERIKKKYRLDPDKPVVYEGQLKLVSEVVMRLIMRILERDKRSTPFIIEGVELKLSHSMKISASPGVVVLGGKIDRVERKDNVLRIVDYKTGRDALEFDSVHSLFTSDIDRNKAAFQTLVYTMLYSKHNDTTSLKVEPGLLNSKMLFDRDLPFGLTMNKQLVKDARELLPEFEARLRELMEEIFNPEIEFDQTEDPKACKFCPYTRICYR